MIDADLPEELLLVLPAVRERMRQRGCQCDAEVIGWHEIEERWDDLPIFLRARARVTLDSVDGNLAGVFLIWHPPGVCPITKYTYADMN